MMISSSVIAVIIIMSTIMATAIRAVMSRFGEIEIVMIGVYHIHPEIPRTTGCIDWPVKVFQSEETSIL